MSVMNIRMDDTLTAWFKRQVETIKSKTYDKKYKNLMSSMLIPISTEANPASRFIIWYSYAKVGIARILSGYNSKDFPSVDVYAEEKESKVISIGSKFSYNKLDIRTSQMTGANLDMKRAETCRRANDEKADNLVWYGDPDYNIQGFFNYPGITSYTLTTGLGGFLWNEKTGDEIILDVTGLMDAVNVPTKGREVVDTILLPRAQYNLIKNKRMEGNSDRTVLEFFKSNNPDVEVFALNELSVAGAGGTDRMMAYVRDPDHLTQEIPQPFEQSEPQEDGMEYDIFCHSRFGGVIVYYPLSVAYSDGI